MSAGTANFDRLAGVYRALEVLAFGRDLERARFCFLDRLRDCRAILVLGEGDGRCLERLARIAPNAGIDCVEASGGMIARTQRRLAGDKALTRVTFIQGDALSVPLPSRHYDAVVTLFFLDCFTNEQVAALVARVQASLLPGAPWLMADFVLPPRGWRRWRARVWLKVLYTFFRWETGLTARVLPDSERLLTEAGWHPAVTQDYQAGLVRSGVFRRPKHSAGGRAP